MSNKSRTGDQGTAAWSAATGTQTGTTHGRVCGTYGQKRPGEGLLVEFRSISCNSKGLRGGPGITGSPPLQNTWAP